MLFSLLEVRNIELDQMTFVEEEDKEFEEGLKNYVWIKIFTFFVSEAIK